MPHTNPATFAQLAVPDARGAADPAPAQHPWPRALRAIGVAALAIASLFVNAAFLLLPVVPA